MSTVSTVLAKLRIRLDETSANEWTDAQLIDYIAQAEQWLAARLGKLVGSGRFRYRETFSLSASTETYALSSLTKRFEEMIEIQLLYNSVYIDLPYMHDGDDGKLRSLAINVPGQIVPHYTLRAESLVFLPVSSEARTIYITYRYLPTFKTSSGESLETPQDWDHLLILRASHFANSDAGVVNTAFDEEYAAQIAEMEEREAGRAFGSRYETVRPVAARSLFN